MLNDNQQRVFDWLNDKLQLPVFAEGYKGALQFINDQSPGYITFVAHAGRDLMNTLAKTVSGISFSRFQYEQHLDRLQNEWKEEWGAKGFNLMDNTENGHLIPFKTCQKIKKLLEEYKRVQLRVTDKDELFFTTFLAYEDKEQIPSNFWQAWIAARKWFVEHAHLREGEFSNNTRHEIVEHFKTLDDLLYVAASSEYERIKNLHEILEETNQ